MGSLSQRKLLVSCVLFTGCAATPSKSRVSAPKSEPAQSSAPSRAEALAQAIERQILPPVQIRGEERFSSLPELMRELKVPAVSIAVFEQDKLVWAQAYGLADANEKTAANTQTLFQAASISKPVNALTLLRVAQEKGLDLNAPVNQYLSSWKVPKHEWSATNPVTLRHLLSHTGGTTVHGFYGYSEGAPIPSTVQILAGQSPSNSPAVVVDQTPGQKFRYSGGGSIVTQLVLEEQLGQPYPKIAAKYSLDPLEMKSSSYEQPLSAPALQRAASGHARDEAVISGKRFVYPELAAAGLWTTPSDLTRFMIAISRARKGKSSLVTPEIAKAMTTTVFPLGDRGMSMGLGPFLRTMNGHKMFGHGGSNQGFRCEMMASVEGGFGYAIMTNSDNGDALIQAIGRTLLSQPGWPGGYEPLDRVPMPAGLAQSLEGFYSSGGLDVVSIQAKGKDLVAIRPFGGSTQWVHLGQGRFVKRDKRVFVQVDKEGKSLVYEQDGEEPKHATRLGAGELAMLWELEQGRDTKALAAWNKLSAKADASELSGYEAQLNRLGYQLAGGQDLDAALKVLRFVTKIRPESSNAQDSLAEIYALRGDNEAAIRHYEQSLALLKKDPTASPSTVRNTQRRVQTVIEGLRKQ